MKYFDKKLIASAIIFLVSFILLLFLSRSRLDFITDYDEGVTLCKSYMLEFGYQLYSQIWADQPPIVYLIFQQLGRYFGFSLELGRLLVILCSSVLLATFFFMLSREHSKLVASLATVSLLVSPIFVHYGTSFMIGVPTLMFQLLSLLMLMLINESSRQNRQDKLLILASGILFGLALFSKLFALEIIPALLVVLVLKVSRTTRAKTFSAVFQMLIPWLIGFLIVSLFVVCQIGAGLSFAFEQMVGTSLQAYQLDLDFDTTEIKAALLRDLVLWFFAAISLITFYNNRNQKLIVSTVWLVTTLLGMLKHKPLFPHHYLTVLIPLIWLAVLGIDQIRFIANQKKTYTTKLLYSASVAVLICWISTSITDTQIRLKERIEPINQEYLQIIKQVSAQSNWILTDHPAYAVFSGIKVPPELVVFSIKRMKIGKLTNQDILNSLRIYKPSVALFLRLPELADIIRQQTELAYQEIRPGLFVSKEVIESTHAVK